MPVGKNGTGDETASVLVNGTKLADIKLPKVTEVVGPRVIDFGKGLKAGSNRVAIQRTGRQQHPAGERDHELLHTVAASGSNSDGKLQVWGHKSAEIEKQILITEKQNSAKRSLVEWRQSGSDSLVTA